MVLSPAEGPFCGVVSRLAPLLSADRPRERLWEHGPSALTATELLAILVGTGARGSNALDVAAELLRLGEGSLRRLAGRSRAEWMRIPGVGPTKAARIRVALELGVRYARETRPAGRPPGSCSGGCRSIIGPEAARPRCGAIPRAGPGQSEPGDPGCAGDSGPAEQFGSGMCW